MVGSVPLDGGNASFTVAPVSFESGIERDPIQYMLTLTVSWKTQVLHTECLGQLGTRDAGSDVESPRIMKRLKASNTVAEKGLVMSVNMIRLISSVTTYLLDGVFETQVWVAFDLVHILRVYEDDRLGRSHNLEDIGSLLL